MEFVELYTYGTEEKDRVFTVPKNWLEEKIDQSVERFKSEYTYDNAEPLYQEALADGVIGSDKLVPSTI